MSSYSSAARNAVSTKVTGALSTGVKGNNAMPMMTAAPMLGMAAAGVALVLL